MSYFANAGQILIEVIFGLAVLLFVLRVLLQLVRANFYNPICQFVYKATNPVLMPMRRVLKPLRNLDSAGAVVAFLLECLKIWLLVAVAGRALGPAATLVLGFADLLSMLVGLYFALILARVILSWVGRDSYHPIVPLIAQLTQPVIAPLRRVLPDLGGFDLSPMMAMVLLMLARALIIAPLQDWGALLALS